jgi:hypothetical protein
MELINGKEYPMWSQFVDKADEFVGKTLEDHDMRMVAKTKVTDISLKPNGKDSAFFTIEGEAFNCGFDVQHGGIGAGEEGWLTFFGYGGHTFRVEAV